MNLVLVSLFGVRSGVFNWRLSDGCLLWGGDRSVFGGFVEVVFSVDHGCWQLFKATLYESIGWW